MFVFIDIKYALRLLFKSPKFTAMTLSVLVGGLTISLYTFSFLYSALYKAIPLPEGNSALAVNVLLNSDQNINQITAYEYAKVRAQLTNFAEFGVYNNKSVRLSFKEIGKNLSASYVDSGFFAFSRTQPILGRTIEASDMVAGAPAVAVISFATWQNELAGDSNVLNRSIRLNDVITDIVGVMPQGYHFPGVAKIWLPLSTQAINAKAGSLVYFDAYARLKDDITIAQAEYELSTAVDNVYQQNVALYQLPEGNKHVTLMSFPMAQTGGSGSVIFTFLNIVSWAILLLACINVGNLLLARSIQRQKETAIRAALGASSKRLISQLMWEGILITVTGGILSLLLVGAALHYTNIILHSWLPNGPMFWWHWGMDSATLAMAVAFTLVTIILAAFLPAWRAAHQDINTTLRDGTRGAQSKKAGRLSRMLVTTQVFLVALLMLIGAMSGYMSQTLINLDLGYDYTNVMRGRVELPKHKYTDPQQQISAYQALMERIISHPQIDGALVSNWMGPQKLTIDTLDYGSDNEKPLVDTISAMGDTQFIGLGLVSGRQLTEQDKVGNRKVAMISQSMAKRYWPGESPLEKRINLEVNGNDEALIIVGVVADRMNATSLFAKLDTEDEVYVSAAQFIVSDQLVYYRTKGAVKNAEDIFYQALFATDRNIELNTLVEPAEKNLNLMRDAMKLTAKITFGTGFFALMLAMVGIYGLTANTVAQRTHEVGIRRAVGATDRSIINMFIKQGIRQLITGLGLALAIFSLLSFGFNEFSDGLFPLYLYPMLAIIVSLGVSAIVLVAIYTPTKRAVIMEPSLALRYE